MVRKVIVCLLFSANAIAADFNCDILHRVDFDEIVEGLQKVNQPLTFMSAAVRISMSKIQRKPDGKSEKVSWDCSGAFISDQGEILSAGHCIDGCRGEDTCSFTLNVAKDKKANRNDDIEIEMTPVYYPKCTSDGTITRYERRENLKEQCAAEEGFGDYLVLRPKNPEMLPDFSCLEVADKSPGTGDGVFTMGFPTTTFRGPWQKVKDAPGDKLVLSSGEVVNKDSCEIQWRPRTAVQEAVWGKASSETVKLPSTLGRELGMIQTTVDAAKGSSGGPLINSKGEIVGVAAFVVKPHGTTKECRGATFFQPVERLKKNLQGKIGTCRQKKAARGASI